MRPARTHIERDKSSFQVVEYSEITPSAARLRNADDSLTYWAANLCIHFFTLDFLRRVCNKHERQLVHHIAKKKGSDSIKFISLA